MMDNLKDKARYSRADLLSLRFEGSARLRPKCANQTELHTLNFWKINGLPSNLSNINSNTTYGSKTCLSPDRENLSLTSSSNGLLSSRRALRNRERAHNYYQRFSSSDQIGGDGDGQIGIALMPPGNMSTSYGKSSNIDHRSISSSHLMPAFAKRRFITASVATNELSNESPQNNVKANPSPNNDDGDTLDLKENIIMSTQDSSSQIRHSNNLIVSPVRNSTNSTNIASAEWEHSDKTPYNQLDKEQSLASSPTFLSSRQGGQGGGNLSAPERRIGSGRLLPRNDNWEYNKNQSTAELNVNNVEKETRLLNGSITNPQRQRTFSGKHSERSNDNLGDRDRRPLERTSRGSDSRDRDQYDGKKNVQSGRRAFNKDKFNFGDSVSQNHRGKRGGNFYQSHDPHEPEWFSAGPKSQHETIDLHGFDDVEVDADNAKGNDNGDLKSKEVNIKANQILKSRTTSRSSSIASLNRMDLNNFKKDSNKTTTPSKQNNSDTHISKSEVEFNFDAFLNMDPMDHALMGNDGEVQGDITGTSRFSRWFGPKEPANNNEIISFLESSTLDAQEKHEIPSVKDLEAQMTKVNIRPEYTMGNPMPNAQQPNHAEQAEKPVTRDTEAFKRLLQQLGSQNNAQPTAPEPYLSNVPTFRGGPGPGPVPPNMHDPYQQHILAQRQDSQVKRDDLQAHQHRSTVKNESLTYNNRQNEPISHSQSHTTLIPYVLEPNVSGPLPLIEQTQKRTEIHHLFQSVVRGDVSFEFLEKELNNPSTSAQSKEIIATVLFEFSNSGRNANVHQKPLVYPNDLNHPHVIKSFPVFNKNIGSNVSEDLLPHGPNQVIGQHQSLRHSNSPTPLAFTPTSVLRKMTADKETTSLHNHGSVNHQQHPHQYHQQQQQQQQYHAKLSGVHNMMNDSSVISAGINMQPRMILGGNYAMQQNQLSVNSPQISPKLMPQMAQSRAQQIKWPGNMQPTHGPKSYGRPILKGSLNSVSQQMAPLSISSNNDLQQIHQQRLKSVQPTETLNNENSLHGGPGQIQNVSYNEGISHMQHHQYLQHQQARQRLIHGDLHRQANMPIHSSTTMTGGPEGTDSAGLMQINRLSPMNFHRDDRLSPTPNQLAQWFSPELLARASAGKLPLLNVNQALSLEEFERNMQHSSATVLN